MPFERGRIDGDRVQFLILEYDLIIELFLDVVQKLISQKIVPESHGHQIYHVIKFDRYESVNFNFRNQLIFFQSIDTPVRIFWRNESIAK